MGLLDPIKNWLINITVKKGLRSAIGVVIAFLTSGAISAQLEGMGITIDKTQLELGLLALVSGILEVARTWLKNKMGLKFL